MYTPVFQEWPSIARLDRPIVITRKLDGTNAAIGIVDLGQFSKENDSFNPEFGDATSSPHVVVLHEGQDYLVYAQSRTKIISPGKTTDNYGFAQWVRDNASTLVADLGPGVHFGEWWGLGIQRSYGMKSKIFSLFNTKRWTGVKFTTPNLDVVEILGTSEYFDRTLVDECLEKLRKRGEASGHEEEGVVIFHTHGNLMFKKTIKGDDKGKSYGA